ncbi:MAG: hypothetical protein LBH09_06885 [Peptococcaceae bacterium]|nr:hypothetical protein [Peptococcaceae bacterium]
MRYILLACLLWLMLCGGALYGDIWEFGTSGSGDYPFLPKGYMIVTDGGEYWLSSRFRNTTGGVLYTGTLNGLSYIEASKADGSAYMLYALTDRNPLDYKYLVAYKNGAVIEDFPSYIGAPGRVEAEDYMGSNANWRIPVVGFPFEPGALYEFAFLRGLRANNGVTLVLSGDGMGYLRNPELPEEVARYEEEKNKEYEFITSYWKIDHEDGSYSWGYNLVPMRFFIQTYADLGIWRKAAEEAQSFLDSVTPADIASGRYVQSNIDNLVSLIEELSQEADGIVRKQLQGKAEESMAKMVPQLMYALDQAMSPEEMQADTSVLEEVLRDAKILYDKASANTGAQLGQYNAERAVELKNRIDQAEALTHTSPQTMINRAVKDLQDAIIRVLNSKVRKPTIVLHDPVSGVKVVVPEGSVPADTVLYVNTHRDAGQTDRMKEYIAKEIEDILFYEIQLSSMGGSILSVEEMEIQIPESSFPERKSISVYYNEGSSEPTRLSSVGTGGYRVFSGEESGTYALVVRAPSSQTAKETEHNDNPPPQEDTVDVTVVEETDIDLETEPDQIREELSEETGPTDEPDDFDYGEEWPQHEILDKVVIPIDDLRKDAEPAPLVLAVAVLALIGVALSVPDVQRRLGKR